MRPAVRVEKLSKHYRLENGPSYPLNLQESMAHGMRSFWRKVRGRAGEHMRDFWALRDVSFEVKPGEVVGILGRNGAGKSTLLKILSRITEPSSGRAELRGRLGSLLEVGTGFHPELTGRENIFLNGSLLGMSRADIRAQYDDIVSFADIPGFLDTPVKRYSSGMYVRLAFAIAVHLHPDILVLDEVLAVGDAGFQRKCLSKMRDVSHDGRTVLFVSHDMAAVRRLCDRAILISKGRITAEGPANDVVTEYLATDCDLLLPNKAIDLTDSKRRGSGMVKFSKVEIHGAENGSNVVANGPMNVRMTLLAEDFREADSLSVVLFDRSGVKILNADTMTLDRPIRFSEGEHRVSMRIHRVPLNPGVYTLGLWLAKRPAAVFDWIEAAGEIEIHEPPGQTRIRPNEDGVVWTEFDLLEAPG
ncbi:MAG: ABC transporter ATP-binding protein [Planctomycetes bacterium]|nr:ABC transporter ATP-binding protein [Planctomycetota bacterium]